MGYRSEVILVVGKEVMPQFMVTMAKSVEARSMCWGDAERVMDYTEEGAVLFRWDYVKWYASYEEVEAIEDFMDWCEGENIEVDGDTHPAMDFFRFVRLGEEADDTEVRGHGFYDVCVQRSIEY
jgi:hypothetical protein